MFAEFEPDAHGEPVAAVVRLATESDLDACADLAQQRNGGELDTWRSRLAVDLADPEKLLVVAEVDGAVVGHAGAGWLSFDPELAVNLKDGWYLTGVVVAPSQRRRGLGRRLVQARLDWLAARTDRAWYFAAAENQASLQLHRELGFSEVTRSFEVPGVSFTGGVGVLSVRFSSAAH
ncbi:GNAT family N-acetyltransferase [Propionicimonas sp.]|uniref:GNAT family N-acetyltransferase n=1 Tax=Propionicimonas sp. TaxID=1955623 RepID=UPI001DB8490B|nr:GNAT family N-acetyltransferase [Propionicimonas sp.]MBU3978025.1 GNAT family N-acetyltransferase [Actinomycetota bacterium]MBU3985469.1 GNAT family N-acetyltransferase [Actinomycetota bacterium]MBU4007564.1 GNAT family N-acetyltransferase [Actinomycetota bacterium]MBU4066542.1 GNAT family N-acetyltransferase [Actinomycetota bacterium]MBU4091884.1 GNAT family N-acetyltransferase [Actinomycetota bacterium]